MTEPMLRLAQKSEPNAETVQSGNTGMLSAVSGVDLQEYLRVLWRQKRVIMATVFVIMALAAAIVYSLPPRYTASAFVEINPRQSRIFDFEAVLSGLPADTETVETEIHIISSRKVARRAVNRMELIRDPEFNPALRPASTWRAWRQSAADWLTARVGSPGLAEARAATADGVPEQAVEGPEGFIGKAVLKLANLVRPAKPRPLPEDERVERETERVVDAFLSRLSVEPEGRSRIIRIAFESSDPETAATAANTTADFYIVAQLEAKFEATKRATTWLSERVAQLRQEVEAKERAIEEFRAQAGLLQGRQQDTTLTSEEVSELNRQHVQELARLAEARARLNQVNRLLESPNGIESAVEVLQSPLIRELRGQETALQRQIAELSEEYGDRHPKMINARAELRDLRAKIDVEVDRIVQGLRNEVAVAQARASSLGRSLARAKEEIARLNQSDVELRALEREAAASRTLLENLLQRTKETVSQESFIQPDANIVSYAIVPDFPSFPKKSVIFPLVLLISLATGTILAFAIDKLDIGFRSTEQLSRLTGIGPLGLVPAVSKLAAMGKRPHDYILENPGSALGEAVRSLHTNILLSDVTQRPKVVLITSTLPREGKTTVVLSLARLLATSGQKVIVVDCDLRRPTIHKELDIPAGPGLTECLTEGATVDEVVQVDQKSGLHVLRAGAPIANMPDELDSGLMQTLLRNLARQYDLVILDSAPVLAVSDTLFIARLADKTVYLVRWARTRRAAVNNGLRQLVAAQADIAGALLTMVDVKSHAQYGYGDSGSYYGKLKKYYTG